MNASASASKTLRLMITLALACCVAFAISLTPAIADDAHAATKLSVSAKVSGKSYTTKTVALNSTSTTNFVGSKSSTAKGLNYVKAKKSATYAGNVTYTVYSGTKSYTAKNGTAAGSSKAITAVKMSLTSTMAKKYDIAYRVYVKGYGWLPWVKNGVKTGTSVTTHPVTALQAKLVTKGKSLGATANYTNARYVSAGFFNLTKDLKIDNAIVTVAKAAGVTSNAKTAAAAEKGFMWVVKNVKYDASASSGTITTKGAIAAARLKTEATKAFVNKKGDCYTMSAAVYWLARYAGLTSSAISGQRAAYAASSYALDYSGYMDKGGTIADDPVLLVKGKGLQVGIATDEYGHIIQALDGNGNPLYLNWENDTVSLTTEFTDVPAPCGTIRTDNVSGTDYFTDAEGNFVYSPATYSWATITIGGVKYIYDPVYQYSQNKTFSTDASKACYKAYHLTYEEAAAWAKGGSDEFESNTYCQQL